MSRAWQRLGVLALLVALMVGCAASGPKEPHGARIDGLYTLPTVTLVGTDGAPRTLRASKPLTLLFFGYANCPDVCTGIIADLATARSRLPERDRGDVEIVVITTDPARDTPAAWGEYLRRIDPDIVGLTGDLGDIVAAGKAVGVEIEKGAPLPSGGYEVDHGSQVLVFDVTGKSRLVWTTGKSIGALKADLENELERVR